MFLYFKAREFLAISAIYHISKILAFLLFYSLKSQKWPLFFWPYASTFHQFIAFLPQQLIASYSRLFIVITWLFNNTRIETLSNQFAGHWCMLWGFFLEGREDVARFVVTSKKHYLVFKTIVRDSICEKICVIIIINWIMARIFLHAIKITNKYD